MNRSEIQKTNQLKERPYERLIRITYDNDRPTVSARELYKTLEVERRFSVWFETNSQGFVEGDDFTSVLSGTIVNQWRSQGIAGL